MIVTIAECMADYEMSNGIGGICFSVEKAEDVKELIEFAEKHNLDFLVEKG